MPDGVTGGVLIVVALVGIGCYTVGKVTHAKPVVKFNHEVCHIVTFGKKCKTQKQNLNGAYHCGDDCQSLCVAGMKACK